MPFLAALQFLTAIPITGLKFSQRDIARSSAYFPLAGAVLGLCLLGANNALSYLFPEPLTNLCLVFVLIILTGGLHLDGLADTLDGLGGGKDKQRMLSIMRDSHKGTFGVIGIIGAILFKVFALSAIPLSMKGSCLFIFPVLSRWSMTIPMMLYPYARSEGKAKLFIDGMNMKIFLWASIFALSLAAAANWLGIAIMLIVAAFTLLSSQFISKKIGGMTGDTLGAINELNEIVVLLSAIVAGKVL